MKQLLKSKSRRKEAPPAQALILPDLPSIQQLNSYPCIPDNSQYPYNKCGSFSFVLFILVHFCYLPKGKKKVQSNAFTRSDSPVNHTETSEFMWPFINFHKVMLEVHF